MATNCLSVDNAAIAQYIPNKRAVFVIDKNVWAIYGEKIRTYANHHKIEVLHIVTSGEEKNKTTGKLFTILREMENWGVGRRDPIIAIGGGVVLDIAGLAASLYRRGIPYVRIPTTLLGIVDVSIAAKTGVNFEGRRNRLGAYYPPAASLLDPTFIATQAPEEISSGMGEILKMAVIKDAELFYMLIEHGAGLLQTKFHHDYAKQVIEMSVLGMKEELENNLWEKDLRRCVDFGHSFSPIIEMRSLSSTVPLRHGEAVTLDILLSCQIAVRRGLMEKMDYGRVVKVVIDLGLPTTHPSFYNPELLWESLQDTVKHRDGSQNLPVPTKIGKHVFLNDVTYNEIECVIDPL